MNQIQLINQYFDQGIQQGTFKVDRYQVEKARAVLLGYYHYYGDESSLYEVVGVETPYQLPIPEVDGENHIGFIDYLLRKKKTGTLVIADLKTASGVDQAYWDELHTNEQLTEYAFSLKQSGHEDVEVRWDVVVKPTISPKDLTKVAKAEIETGSYCGVPLKDCEIPEDGKESPEMYGIRCLQWYLDQPENRYHRRIFERDNVTLLAHWENMKRRVQAIRDEQRNYQQCKDQFDQPLLPLPTFSACKRFDSGKSRMCDYHLICCGADPDRTGYQERQPVESRVKLDGFSVSRFRCHAACPREHHFKYTEKIEPRCKTSSASLDFGTLFHSAFEHVMRSQMTDEIKLPLGEPNA